MFQAVSQDELNRLVLIIFFADARAFQQEFESGSRMANTQSSQHNLFFPATAVGSPPRLSLMVDNLLPACLLPADFQASGQQH